MAFGSPATPICPSIRLRLGVSVACTAATAPGTTPKKSPHFSAPPALTLTLGADVMVGFPGETDREFAGDPRFHPLSSLRLPASLPVFAPPRHAGLGSARRLARTRRRRQRTHGCPPRSRRMKRYMRIAPLRRTELDAITLNTPPALAANGRTSALTGNFLPVELAAVLPANQTRTNPRQSSYRWQHSSRIACSLCHFHLRFPTEPLASSDQPVSNRLLSHSATVGFGIKPMLYSGCVARPAASSGRFRIAAPDDYWRSTIALDKRSAKSFIRINDRIRAREIRVIDENGEQLGILPPFEALKIARERGLDLVEVSPNAVPPVCRIQDYGRFLYEKEKSERAAKKKQKVIVVKEVKFSVTVDEHDYQTKKNQAVRFLAERRQGEGEPALPRPPDGPP